MDHATWKPIEDLQEHDEVDTSSKYDACVCASPYHVTPHLSFMSLFLTIFKLVKVIFDASLDQLDHSKGNFKCNNHLLLAPTQIVHQVAEEKH